MEIRTLEDYGYQVLNKEFYKGRWYVTINKTLHGKTKIPNYIWVWMINNPAFEFIPKGYVIHHLDHDKTNDDPSNLVLMQKFHHVAHHFKQKKIMPEIKISPEWRESNLPIPVGKISEPKIYKASNGKGYRIYYFDDGPNGKRVQKAFGKYNGKPLLTMEDALALKKDLMEFVK